MVKTTPLLEDTQSTVLQQMLHDRGYSNVSVHDGEALTPSLALLMSALTQHPDGSAGVVLAVYVTSDPVVKVHALRELELLHDGALEVDDGLHLDGVLQHKVHTLIVISERALTSFALRDAQSRLLTRFMHFFRRSELSFNVARHCLQPQCTPVLPRNEDKLIRELALPSKHALLRLQNSDPLCRYFGWQPGQVVGMRRCLANVAPQMVYRYVIDTLSGH